MKLEMGALMWISQAERRLIARELCHALAVEVRTTDLNLRNVPSSVVHEPSGLESLGTQLLAARTGVDKPTRAPWRLEPAWTGVHEPTRTLDSSLLAVLGGF